jgi:outer membrane protein, heavy metal efflux system
MKYNLVLAWPLLMAAPLLAQTSDQSLPGLSDAAVVEAIEAHPRSRAADARVEAARQEANALGATQNEFTVSGDVSRRTIQDEGRYAEYTVSLERPIRLPGKSALDRKAGALGVRVAELRAEDARHQLALQLNELW